jgi:hypothetical protein
MGQGKQHREVIARAGLQTTPCGSIVLGIPIG